LEDEMDQLKILEILEKNKELEFVQRILNADDYPSLPNRDGSESTHSMAWGELDGRFLVYPTVIYQEDELMRLGPDTALGHAMRSGDFIEFESETEAQEFSSQYKGFSDRFYKDKIEKEIIYPKRKSIWKDLNTGPGTISQDSLGD
jgi:hypothetical protein